MASLKWAWTKLSRSVDQMSLFVKPLIIVLFWYSINFMPRRRATTEQIYRVHMSKHYRFLDAHKWH